MDIVGYTSVHVYWMKTDVRIITYLNAQAFMCSASACTGMLLLCFLVLGPNLTHRTN